MEEEAQAQGQEMPTIEVSIETYGKAVLVTGNTKVIKDFLKERGGHWNPSKCGWIFPGSKKTTLIEGLRSRENVAVKDLTRSNSNESAASAGHVLVVGDTKKIRRVLKKLGGTWNYNQQGWTFPSSEKDKILCKKLPSFQKCKNHFFSFSLFF